MKRKATEKLNNFHKGYKDLPIKTRASLIKIARNLLKQQKENNALLADASLPKSEDKKA